MADWDGRGLPPAAEARLARARASGVRTSLLPVAGQVGMDSCGFAPVGEVMGCVVQHIGWQGYGGCGWMMGMSGGFAGGPMVGGQMRQGGFAGAGMLGGYGYGYAPPPMTTATQRSGGYFGFGPFLAALNAGWEGAIGRMLTECREIGGDGVVGISLEEHHLGEGNREFLALGTAVRSLGATHVAHPFSTTLSGQDVAKLMHSGWVPVAALVAISVGVRHNDYMSQRSAMTFSPNVEVPAFTDLVHTIRADARNELAYRAHGSGADGAILTEPMRIAVHELEVGENHRDLVGEAWLTATSVARFAEATHPAARPLSILPLRPNPKESR